MIDLILKHNQKTIKPIRTPRRSVKEMVQDYEDNIIEPPLQFRDEKPHMSVKQIIQPPFKFRDKLPTIIEEKEPPILAPRIKKPLPLPSTIINETAITLKGYTKSYEIGIKNEIDSFVQLQSTRKAIEIHIEKN